MNWNDVRKTALAEAQDQRAAREVTLQRTIAIASTAQCVPVHLTLNRTVGFLVACCVACVLFAVGVALLTEPNTGQVADKAFVVSTSQGGVIDSRGFTNLAAAVSFARPGDTIVTSSGRVTERLSISMQLRLEAGSGSTISKRGA